MTDTPKTAAQALAQIEAMISGGDRATVNEQNAFEHFTAQNRLLMQIRDIARAPRPACGVQTVEAVADAIDNARYQHPEHPRERPRPFAEADKSDREYALRLARAALAVSSATPSCACGGDMAHDYHQDWCPAVPSAMRAPEPLCECLGGSTYNDGAQRRCDVCGLPVPVASRLTSTEGK